MTPPPGTTSAGFIPGDPSLCLTGGNVIVLSGDEKAFVHPGFSITRDADFNVIGRQQQNYVTVHVEGRNRARTPRHSLTLSGRRLFGPLRIGNYPRTAEDGADTSGVAGLSVASDHRACSESNGNFYIHDIVWLGERVMRLTTTFTVNCVQRQRDQPKGFLPPVPDPNAKVTVTVASISGCVHYDHGAP